MGQQGDLSKAFGEDGFLKSMPESQKEKIRLERAIAEENQRRENESLADQLQNLKMSGPAATPFASSQTKTQNIGGIVTLDKVYGNSSPGGKHLILGTANPTAGADTNLFTVLGKHTCQVTILWACNRRIIKSRVRVGFDVAGGGTNIPGDGDWIYYDLELPGNSTLVLDAATGLFLGAADDVVVRTDISGVSFGASGMLYETV